MSAIRIVTDSTADLGARAGEWGVAVVPLTVSFGDETLLDSVEIDPRAFFERLASTRAHPTTSQPAPERFEQIYQQLLDEGAAGIVSLHVSATLSGTIAAAQRAVTDLQSQGVSTPIEVIDSHLASIAMHFGIQAACRAASETGADIAAVSAAARDAFARTSVYFVADDLEYLRRGGRIGQARRVVGTLLSVKPIITLRDGVVAALDTPRTRRRAYERLAELVRDLAPVESVIIAQSSPDLGDELEGAVRQFYDGPIHRTWAGPTIGSHVGPGAAGLALLRATS